MTNISKGYDQATAHRRRGPALSRHELGVVVGKTLHAFEGGRSTALVTAICDAIENAVLETQTDQPVPPVAPPTDARLREIASGVYGPNRQEGKAMAAELLLSRNAIRYHEEYDRLWAAAQAADPAIAAIAATCEHRFFDDAGSRVYLYCQRGCGTRDPLESATPATADERGR